MRRFPGIVGPVIYDINAVMINKYEFLILIVCCGKNHGQESIT